jgi:hypothetical protein
MAIDDRRRAPVKQKQIGAGSSAGPGCGVLEER